MKAIEQFQELGACAPARKWVGERTLEQAWEECERADWLLWWSERSIGRYGITCDAVESAACDCAETALKYVPAGVDSPRLAIEATRRDIAERTPESAAARDAARAAARDAVWDATSNAACASAWAAACASAWAAASNATSNAVRDAAWAAASNAAWGPARAVALRDMCQLVRDRIRPIWEGQ